MTNTSIKPKKKKPIMQVFRVTLQIICFVFLPSIYIGAFSGIQQIWVSIINRSFNFVTLLPQMIEVITVIPITLLLGRFFCGWMCAFGAMGDFISTASAKLFKHRPKINENADSALKLLKYILLIFIVIGVWTLNTSLFSAASPWDAFGMLFTAGKLPDFSYVAANLLPALIILIIIIIGSFFIDRFFCRYLCPLGAVFAIVSKLRVTRVLKPKEHCGSCRICTDSCAMGIPLYKKDSIKSGECINCYKCISVCPRRNVTAAVLDSDVRPVLAGSMAVFTMAGISYAGNFATTLSAANITAAQSASDTSSSSTSQTETSSTAQDAVSSSSGEDSAASQAAVNENNAAAAAESGNPQTSSAVDSSAPISSSGAAESSSTQNADAKYKDGTYEGSGAGFRRGTTTVSVTVKNGEITDIQILSHGDDAPFFNRAYPTVIQEILSQQETEVDAVSGATFSSRGIMSAVADALSNA